MPPSPRSRYSRVARRSTQASPRSCRRLSVCARTLWSPVGRSASTVSRLIWRGTTPSRSVVSTVWNRHGPTGPSEPSAKPGRLCPTRRWGTGSWASGIPRTRGDIVVLGVPYPAVADVLAKQGDNLAGKIVVDITNPLNFETFDSLTVPADSSATAEIADALPRSRVLKAFNTTFAGTLAAGQVGPLTTTVLVAGDDAEAKSTLMGVVTAGGLHALDAGTLARARELEALGFLQITLAANEKVPWTGGFGIVS